jgi:hypothetical protein
MSRLVRGIRRAKPFHGRLSLHQRPRHVGIRDAGSSWDQSSNHRRVVRALRAGPQLHTVVQHGGNVVHGDKRPLSDEVA